MRKPNKVLSNEGARRAGRAAAVVATLHLLTAGGAQAADAVAFQSWDGAGVLGPGGTITATGFAGGNSSYSDNPALDHSSWAHTGDWWLFELSAAATTTVSVTAQAGHDFVPGLSVWASGASPFDGGTTGFGGEVSSAGFGTPHSFNSTGAQGDSGTLWMASGSGGNLQETLGYAVAGPSHDSATTGWGEDILTGAHDVSLTNMFESGVSGAVGADFVQLVFTGLQAGHYALFVGGTDHATAGGLFDVQVSAVPIPGAVYLFGSALLGLAGLARKGRTTAVSA